jgi:hypothetical protein
VLHLLSKKALWSVTRETALQRLAPESGWRLRNAKDAMALELIGGVTGKRIAKSAAKVPQYSLCWAKPRTGSALTPRTARPPPATTRAIREQFVRFMAMSAHQ